MEIEGEDDTQRRLTTVSIIDVLLNLIRNEKMRELAIMDEDKPVTLDDLGKSADDQKIFDCPLDLRNQRIIRVDSERTRVVELKFGLENSKYKQDEN